MGATKGAISIKIKCQVAQSYLGTRSNDPNTTQDHISGALSLNTKNMFNSGSNSGPCPVSLLLPVSELTIARSFALKVFPVTVGLQALYCILRTICRICPNVFTGILGIKKFLKNIAVMHIGAGHRVRSDKFIFHINRNMILVPKEVFVILSGPAGISIFLPLLALTPSFGLVAILDLLVFVTSVTLYRNLNNAGTYGF